jgi:DNA-binding NarL/FixJ family response regulator
MAPRKSAARIRLLLIDPYELIPAELRDGLAAKGMLAAQAAGEPNTRPDAVLLAPPVDTLPARAIIKFAAIVRDIPIIVYDAAPSMQRQANTFGAGAGGYVIGEVTSEDIAPVVDVARHGGFACCRRSIEFMRERLQAPAGFSQIERQIVALVTTGAEDDAIAEQLSMPERKVKEILSRVFRKAGASSRIELAAWWMHWAMGEDDPLIEGASDDVRFVTSA